MAGKYKVVSWIEDQKFHMSTQILEKLWSCYFENLEDHILWTVNTSAILFARDISIHVMVNMWPERAPEAFSKATCNSHFTSFGIGINGRVFATQVSCTRTSLLVHRKFLHPLGICGILGITVNSRRDGRGACWTASAGGTSSWGQSTIDHTHSAAFAWKQILSCGSILEYGGDTLD